MSGPWGVYAHDADCNTIHIGPDPCPPPCPDGDTMEKALLRAWQELANQEEIMLLKTTRTAVLTVAALDQLAATEGQCCEFCCGQCWVLSDMMSSGELDTVVHRAPAVMYEPARWYDPSLGQVNKVFVKSKMSDPLCEHEGSSLEGPVRLRLHASGPRHGATTPVEREDQGDL